jgi:diguanylate cyclase (GGDEF)-like protein
MLGRRDMNKSNAATQQPDIEQEELRGFSRSIAEIEWLLLILGILYLFVPTAVISDRGEVIGTMVAFAGFVLAFRYVNFYRSETRWKLALETWAMLGLISVMLWHTGKVDSPLLNLYLLVIVACALTLGKLATFMEVALISCWYLYMGYSTYGMDVFSLQTFSVLMSTFSPFLLVAYLTTMLSADIYHAKSRIVSISETDELTGLPNMRAFKALQDREMKRYGRYGHPFSLMMIDTDGLKEVNDRYGHEAGNRLIVLVANTIRERMRNADTLARYGGDEFLLLLPETSSSQVLEVAERIRAAVEHCSFDERGARVSTTVSIGVASCPDDAINVQDLIDKADAALYQSKNQGRNRTTLWRKPVPSTAKTTRPASAA